MTLAFLDLETTGIDRQFTEDHCPILEVAVLLTDDNVVPFDSRSLLVEPREDGTGARVCDFDAICEPGALAMHRRNGLLAEIDERKPGPIELAQEALLDWLDSVRPDGEPRGTWPLVGFGVGRFDVPLLARWLPDVLAQFHYRTLDVRTLTEVTRRWGDFGGAPTERKSHRALADCQDAAAVLRWWRERYMPPRDGREPAAPHQTGVEHGWTDSGISRDGQPVHRPAPGGYIGSQRDTADRWYG